MTFSDITRLMLNSMDFFELRRTAGRYNVAFQGVRRQKLIKDIERKILEKNMQGKTKEGSVIQTELAAGEPMFAAAVSARPDLKGEKDKKSVSKINTFSARHAISRLHSDQKN